MLERSNNVVTTVQTLHECHAKALALLQSHLHPILAEYFTHKQPNSDLLVIDPSAPQYVRNLQVILNVMLLISRGLTIGGNDNDRTTTLINLPEYYNFAKECVQTLRHFNLQASPETQQLLSILKKKDQTLFNLFTEETPELAKLSEKLTNMVGTDATFALTKVIQGVSRYLNQDQEKIQNSSRTRLEDIAAHAAPKLGNALDLKDENRRYILNPNVDGEIITAFKRIGNSLDYLNEALSFENDKIISGFFEGLLSYKEVISTVCSISPLAISTSAKIKGKIHGLVEEFKPALKEIILRATRLEDDLGLRPGYFLDEIKPYVTRYFEFAKNIGMPLSNEEETLFLLERQQLRQRKYGENQNEQAKLVELKSIIDKVETLLYTYTPIADFNQDDLQTLKSSLPVLALPQKLKIDFEKEIDAAIQGQGEATVVWGFLKNILGHDISLQNQVWRAVKDNFEDIDSREATLASQQLVIRYNQLHDDFSIDTVSATVVAEEQVSSPEELALLNQQINASNIKMADLTKELRDFLLKNIEAYFSDTVVDNIHSSDTSGIFEIYSDDPEHIQDIKNLLSALTVLEVTFRKAEKSYLSAAIQALQLKEIASRFHLNHQHHAALLKLIYENRLTNVKEVATELSSQTKAGFQIKTEVDHNKLHAAGDEKKIRGFFDLYEELFDLSEYAYSYLNVGNGSENNTINLLPYAAQMRNIEDLIEKFLSTHFEKDVSQLFIRNKKGLYIIQDDDSPLVKDSKSLLNALHHGASLTKDVNTFLHGSYWDMIAVLRNVSTFIKTLNEVNLDASHSQICDLRRQLLAAIQIAVDQQINPILEEAMKQFDTAEQAIGLRQGVLTNPIQSAIDFYQAQSLNLGINVTHKDDDAFLISRNEEHSKFLEEARAELSVLVSKKRQADLNFAMIKAWLKEVTGNNPSISSFELLVEVRSNIRLLGGENVRAEFTPLLDNMINNFHEMLRDNKEEFDRIYTLLRKQIIIRHALLKANQVAAENALNQFNAIKGHRMEVIEEHQETLALNAAKAEQAKHIVLSATILENKAREALSEGNLANAKLFQAEAEDLTKAAQKLATDSHQGSAKREAEAAHYETQSIERDLKIKMNPTPAPEVKGRGFVVETILSILRVICEALDAIILSFRALFTSPKAAALSSKRPAHATPPKWATHSQGDNGPKKASEPKLQPSLPLTQPVKAPKEPRLSNLSLSYTAARSSGFFAELEDHSLDADDLRTVDTESIEEDECLLDAETRTKSVTLQD